MEIVKTCRAVTKKGEQCGAPLVHDSDFCVFHNPDFADTLQEARKAGGQRSRREATLATAYRLEGLDAMALLHRLWEIVTYDVLPLDNTFNRARVILGIITAGVKLREVGEHEERLKALEAALGPRLQKNDNPRRNR